MNYTFGKHRLLFIVIGVAVVALASLPFLMSASCLTRPQTLAEQKTLDTMRNMTRNDVLPSEDAVAAIENQFPNTKAAGLARVLRARIKLNARDYAGAASLLDARVIRDQTSIYDYALSMRGNALEQTGKDAEARAVYQELLHQYEQPSCCYSVVAQGSHSVRRPCRSVDGGEGIRTDVGSNPGISFVSSTLFFCTSFRRSGRRRLRTATTRVVDFTRQC